MGLIMRLHIYFKKSLLNSRFFILKSRLLALQHACLLSWTSINSILCGKGSTNRDSTRFYAIHVKTRPSLTEDIAAYSV